MICDGRHLQMQVEILSIHPKVFFLWLDMGPTLKSDLFPSETSMKKTNFDVQVVINWRYLLR